jgi:CpeT protein
MGRFAQDGRKMADSARATGATVLSPTVRRVGRHFLPLALLVAVLPGCALLPKPKPAAMKQAEADLPALRDAMVGSFSSAEQAAADPENFYDIRLHMAQIWPERKDGVWLYIEQAAARSIDRPYRQRVYRLTAMPDGAIESAVFELPSDVEQYAGGYRNPAVFANVTPEQLTGRPGCSVIMRKAGEGSFVGKTAGTSCESVLRGARYATSEVTITPAEWRVWDRGFNEKNEQVWGSTVGPYIFRKVTREEAETSPAGQATEKPAASRPAASEKQEDAATETQRGAEAATEAEEMGASDE